LAIDLDAVTAAIDDEDPPLLIELDGGRSPEEFLGAGRLLTRIIGR
jgi:hypothetical protein